MTTTELANSINLMMGEDYSEDLLSAYITQAQNTCANWEYHLIGKPEDLDLSRYDEVVIDAVIVGLSIQGAEGETQHSENGILRGFKYSDMRTFIKNHVVPYAKTI